MSAEKRAKAAQLHGFLEMLLSKTDGGESQIFALMVLEKEGKLIWKGRAPLPRRKK